jgi:hypothetical protein
MSNSNINYCLPPYPDSPPPAPWLDSRATSSSEYPNGQFFGSYQSYGETTEGGKTIVNCAPPPDISLCGVDPSIPTVQHYVNIAKNIGKIRLGIGAYQNQEVTRPFNPLVASLVSKGNNKYKQGYLVFN